MNGKSWIILATLSTALIAMLPPAALANEEPDPNGSVTVSCLTGTATGSGVASEYHTWHFEAEFYGGNENYEHFVSSEAGRTFEAAHQVLSAWRVKASIWADGVLLEQKSCPTQW